jgi:hypothetical protein
MATTTLATAQAHAKLTEDVASLAARVGRNCTRGADDVSELWRLIRLARTLGERD